MVANEAAANLEHFVLRPQGRSPPKGRGLEGIQSSWLSPSSRRLTTSNLYAAAPFTDFSQPGFLFTDINKQESYHLDTTHFFNGLA